MFALVYLTLSVVGVLLEATLLPLPLGLVFIIVQSSKLKVKNYSIMLAFFVGILADILMLRPVGTTGAVYGGVVVLLRLYSRKFEVARLSYLLPFTAVVIGPYSWFFYLAWRQQVAIALVVVVVVRSVTSVIQRRYGRLKL